MAKNEYFCVSGNLSSHAGVTSETVAMPHEPPLVDPIIKKGTMAVQECNIDPIELQVPDFRENANKQPITIPSNRFNRSHLTQFLQNSWCADIAAMKD